MVHPILFKMSKITMTIKNIFIMLFLCVILNLQIKRGPNMKRSFAFLIIYFAVFTNIFISSQVHWLPNKNGSKIHFSLLDNNFEILPNLENNYKTGKLFAEILNPVKNSTKQISVLRS